MATPIERATNFVYLRGIICGDRKGKLVPPPATRENIKRVWLVMNETMLDRVGLMHGRTAFLQDQCHDWNFVIERGRIRIRFHGNWEYKKACDLALEYYT